MHSVVCVDNGRNETKVTGHSIEMGLKLLDQTTSLPRNLPFYNRISLR